LSTLNACRQTIRWSAAGGIHGSNKERPSGGQRRLLHGLREVAFHGTNHAIRTVTPDAQTWNITAHGDIATVRNAQAEVSAILETPITPASAIAAFATNNGCAALSFTGNGTTDSYDRSAAASGRSGHTAGDIPIIMEEMSAPTEPDR